MLPLFTTATSALPLSTAPFSIVSVSSTDQLSNALPSDENGSSQQFLYSEHDTNGPVWPHKKFNLFKGCQRQFKRMLRTPSSNALSNKKDHGETSADMPDQCKRCQLHEQQLDDLNLKYSKLQNEVTFLHQRLVAVQHAFTSLRTVLLASFPVRSDNSGGDVFVDSFQPISSVAASKTTAPSPNSMPPDDETLHGPASIDFGSHSVHEESVRPKSPPTLSAPLSARDADVTSCSPSLSTGSGVNTTHNLLALSVDCHSDDDRSETVSLPSTTSVAEPPLSTVQLAALVLERTEQQNVSSRALNRALGIPTRKRIKDLLRNPKPWNCLSFNGQVIFHRLYNWLLHDITDRSASEQAPIPSPTPSLPHPLSVQSTDDTSCTVSAPEDPTSVEIVPHESQFKASSSASDPYASPRSFGSALSNEMFGPPDLASAHNSTKDAPVSSQSLPYPSSRYDGMSPSSCDVETQKRICDILSAARQAMLQQEENTASQLLEASRHYKKKRKRSSASESVKPLKSESKAANIGDAAQPFFSQQKKPLTEIQPFPQSGHTTLNDCYPCSTHLPVVVSLPLDSTISAASVHSVQNVSIPPPLQAATAPFGLILPESFYQNRQLANLVNLLASQSAGATQSSSNTSCRISDPLAHTPSVTLASAPHIQLMCSAPHTRINLPIPSEPLISQFAGDYRGVNTMTLGSSRVPTVIHVDGNTFPASVATTTCLTLNGRSNATVHVSASSVTPTTQLFVPVQSSSVTSSSTPSVSSYTTQQPTPTTTQSYFSDLELSEEQLSHLLDQVPPLDTAELARKAKTYLRENNVSQRNFGEFVLNMSQASVSDLLNKPRAWHYLSVRCRLAFLRLHLWLQQRANSNESTAKADPCPLQTNNSELSCSDDPKPVDPPGTNSQATSRIETEQELPPSNKRDHSRLTGESIMGTPSKLSKTSNTLGAANEQHPGFVPLSDSERQSLFDIAKAATVAMQRANSSYFLKSVKSKSSVASPAKSANSSKTHTPSKQDQSATNLDPDLTFSIDEALFKCSPGRNRIVFTQKQKEVLVTSFNAQPYPSPDQLRDLAKELHLSYKTVLNWFHNRRMRSRTPRSFHFPTQTTIADAVSYPSMFRECSPVKNIDSSAETVAPLKSAEPENVTSCLSTQTGHSNRRKRPDPSRLITPRL